MSIQEYYDEETSVTIVIDNDTGHHRAINLVKFLQRICDDDPVEMAKRAASVLTEINDRAVKAFVKDAVEEIEERNEKESSKER